MAPHRQESATAWHFAFPKVYERRDHRLEQLQRLRRQASSQILDLAENGGGVVTLSLQQYQRQIVRGIG